MTKMHMFDRWIPFLSSLQNLLFFPPVHPGCYRTAHLMIPKMLGRFLPPNSPSDHCSPPRCREEVKLVATRCRKRTSCARKTIQSHSSGDCGWKEWMENLGRQNLWSRLLREKTPGLMENLDEQGEKNSVEMGWQWLDGKRTGWKMLKWFKGKGQGAG